MLALIKRKPVFAWALYDWANSAFATTVMAGFFPLFNRDRLRVGDLVAGTWVVVVERAKLSHDLVAGTRRGQRHFPEAALRDYGIYELQTLETVLRGEREQAIATVAQTIRGKYDLPDDHDDYGFLADFYAALCARLEQRMALGERRASKHEAPGGSIGK